MTGCTAHGRQFLSSSSERTPESMTYAGTSWLWSGCIDSPRQSFPRCPLALQFG